MRALVRRPLRPDLAQVRGVEHALLRGMDHRDRQAAGTDVFLQQEYRRVNRSHDLGPVRGPNGVDPTDASRLEFIDNDQDGRLSEPDFLRKRKKHRRREDLP